MYICAFFCLHVLSISLLQQFSCHHSNTSVTSSSFYTSTFQGETKADSDSDTDMIIDNAQMSIGSSSEIIAPSPNNHTLDAQNKVEVRTTQISTTGFCRAVVVNKHRCRAVVVNKHRCRAVVESPRSLFAGCFCSYSLAQ